jgi:transcriptional regulator with XRE-family HTH domain
MVKKYQKEEEIFLLNIGKRIREIRTKKSISQEKLANMASIDRAFMGRVERGERNISILRLKKIADVLGVHLKDIFD